MKVIIYTSGQATTLQKILQSPFYNKIKPDIALIVHDNGYNKNLKTISEQKKIHTLFISYQEKKVSNKKEQGLLVSNILLEKANELKADNIFCFGDKILKGDLLTEYKNKIINFHPSLLPAFKGINAISQALNYPALLSGNTAHFIDAGIDTGPIIMQSLFSLHQFNTFSDVLDMQIPMFYQIYLWLNENRIQVFRRKVEVENASYKLNAYIPNLEIF